ncbi:VacJ family lipoprotein [Metallibacterium sp.]|uniref:MlaA family lipoprotein n=1 Tax=Metallibacterium sp. TaxID=2940281 RepID=UPI0026283EE0|nr:VacJ family lipoprotein [Metallibacterium sp.]
MPSFSRALRLLAAIALLVAVAGCAIQPARDDDPWQATNRKIFNFNQKFDNAVAKPVARGYVKVTSAEVRLMVSNFFDNLQMPISIVNDVLQVRPVGAAQNTGRFLVNSTIGLAGLFDPAGKLGLHQDTTDFGVTLARWGVPQGPYLVIPFLGPSSMRDFPAYLLDTYFLNPMSYWVRDYHFRYYTEYLPYTLYLVQLRASLLNTDQFLSSAYDPYVMLRDAYLQRRNYLIYHGNPPISLQENLNSDGAGGSDNGGGESDMGALLARQRAYDQAHATQVTKSASTPAAAASAQPAVPASIAPTPAGSVAPAHAASVAPAASSARAQGSLILTPAPATSASGG